MRVDLLIAILPSLLFGPLAIIIMYLGGDNRQQTLGEISGGFLVALVSVPFFAAGLTWQAALIGFVAGILLAIGIHYQIQSFYHVGVSRAMPISTAGQIVVLSVMGIIMFAEWRRPGALPVGLAGVALVTLGVVLANWSDRREVRATDLHWGRGLLALAISTFGLTSYILLLRYYSVDPLQVFLPLIGGSLAGALVLTSPRFTPELGPVDTRWSINTVRQMIPGVLWGLGVIVMQVSIARVGVATGFTLSQLGVIISAAGGVIILKERRTRRELWLMTLGIALLIGGAVLVGVAKALDAG
ncbi:GRP family sugar transporter [Scrofimicrobium sp. R131]|uniref:GRP family sugar transporter n=1 Tax=Scrofimicrobium appendicitidis TaxID=3079930 RepID=A0AAU7V5B4_9ACTO